MKHIITMLLITLLSLPALAGSRSETLRTKDGKLIRAGDTKTYVLKKLGMPDMQQGGVWYYTIGDKLYRFDFGGDKVVHISKE